MATKAALKKKQDKLKQQVMAHLDFVMGSVTSKGPNTYGHNLTFKVEGKTVSAYIPKALVDKTREMTQTHQKLRALLHELSDVNWELLKLEGK